MFFPVGCCFLPATLSGWGIAVAKATDHISHTSLQSPSGSHTPHDQEQEIPEREREREKKMRRQTCREGVGKKERKKDR